jgi:hypothetical protein
LLKHATARATSIARRQKARLIFISPSPFNRPTHNRVREHPVFSSALAESALQQ